MRADLQSAAIATMRHFYKPQRFSQTVGEKPYENITKIGVEMEGIKPSSARPAHPIVHTVCFIRYIFGVSFEKSHLKQGKTGFGQFHQLFKG